MSNYDVTPIPPRPATVQEVLRQMEILRQQLESQLRNAQNEAIQKALQRALEVQRQHEQRIRNSLATLDRNQRERLDALDRNQRERLAAITRDINNEITRVQREMAENVNHQMADLRTDIEDRFQGVDKRINTEVEAINQQMKIMADSVNQLATNIDSRFQEVERNLEDVNTDLAQIHQHFQNEDEQAIQDRETALALWNVVKNRSMLDRFVPTEVQNVGLTVQWLEDSQNHGAALTAQATQALNDIRLAEIHATQEKAKHDALVDIAMAQVERVLTVVNDNRIVNHEVKGGDPMEVENEFWSEGEYGRLKKELKDLLTELEDRYNNNLTTGRINAIARRSAQIEARIMQICTESVAKAILSEARVETVEDIINAIKEKGWMLKGLREGKPENNYMGGEVDNDWRKGVFAVLENNLGEKITIIVDPESDTQNKLVVHQETKGKTAQDVHNQMLAIQQQLCNIGYTIGETTSGATHIPEMGSATSLGQAQATNKVREKIQGQNC